MADYTISKSDDELTITRNNNKVFAHGETVTFDNTTGETATISVYDPDGTGLASPLSLANPFDISGTTTSGTIDGHYGDYRLGVKGTPTDVRLPAARYVVDIGTSSTFRPSGGPTNAQQRKQGEMLSFHCNAAGKTVNVHTESGAITQAVLTVGSQFDLTVGYTTVTVKDDAALGNFYFEVTLTDGGTTDPIRGYIKVITKE